MAIELTDEMRQAVHEEDCRRNGHAIALNNLLTRPVTDNGVPTGPLQPLAPDAGRLPFISCDHCGKVLGILIPEEGRDYDEADSKVRELVRDTTRLDRWRKPKPPKPPRPSVLEPPGRS